MCPHCNADKKRIQKKGFFPRRGDGRRSLVQRYLCRACGRRFSRRTNSPFRGERKSWINGELYRLLCAGVSQRECARVLAISRKTVARKMARLGKWAKALHEKDLEARSGTCEVVFDEMESFEHTKCKPLSIAVAVEKNTRHIFAAEVASMPAKGTLAAIARKKYGYRPDHRVRALNAMFDAIKKTNVEVTALRSDQCPRYPSLVKKHYPHLPHYQFKGRRGCVVGQGELKRGGFDPLFSLNHTCAMFRDRIKRLSRRTWCTTKRSESLQNLLYLYTVSHNHRLTKGKRRLRFR